MLGGPGIGALVWGDAEGKFVAEDITDRVLLAANLDSGHMLLLRTKAHLYRRVYQSGTKRVARSGAAFYAPKKLSSRWETRAGASRWGQWPQSSSTSSRPSRRRARAASPCARGMTVSCAPWMSRTG